MQDLTTGSLTNHLLKTTSFMLVSMMFQTLYILVDLFWVGRLGTDAVAAVGIAGNLSFIVIAPRRCSASARRRWCRMRPAARITIARSLVFNQSQVLSIVVARVFLAVAMLTRRRTRAEQSADDGMRERDRAIPAVVHSGDGAAVRHGRDGRGAARHRQFQARA